ncbi:MAG: hydroxyacid dehydrogenase [Clostridiales bacterium]|nr:hydroxyacid dehydrogenase [Clostridiales bacterium]
MKVLHIGKEGNMERYTVSTPFIEQLEKVSLPNGLDTARYLEAAGDADFLIADAVAPVTGALIRGMPNLKLIHSEGVAFNSFDVEAATAQHVYVCNCQGMNASAVAEQAILLMVGMLRDAVNNDAAVRTGAQIATKEGYMKRGDLRELADCSVGLVGFGDIAQATAKLLRAYGVEEIYYYKRHPLTREAEQRLGVSYLPLEELLGRSDIVSLHLPVSPSTMHTADSAFFAQMKEGSYFVNTARGELVDDEALVDALASGKLAMAGLDTLDHEPVQADHYLLRQPEDISRRLLFSPHIGGITASSFRRGYQMVWEDIQAVAEGQVPRRAVNRW